jgi:ankyrin repeat protein
MRKDRPQRRSLTRGLCIAAALLAACTPSAEHARERLERSGIPVETNSFVQAAADRDVATIRLFVASGLEINRLHSGTGISPLMAAAAAGRTESVRLLIEKGGSVWQRSRSGETALMFAVRHCRSEPAVTALLRAGSNPNASDANGDTPLFMFVASARGLGCKQEVLSALLKAGAQPTQADRHGLSALERAVQLRDGATVATLLAAGAEPNHAEPQERRTALHWAAVGGNADIVRMLLRAGARPDALDSQGRTPAQWANGNAPIEWLLREAGTQRNGPAIGVPSQ